MAAFMWLDPQLINLCAVTVLAVFSDSHFFYICCGLNDIVFIGEHCSFTAVRTCATRLQKEGFSLAQADVAVAVASNQEGRLEIADIVQLNTSVFDSSGNQKRAELARQGPQCSKSEGGVGH